MKRIVLKSMHFLNFKGVRELTIEFNEDLTTIKGDNGTGKTTIFDGFTWLLFGKDSKDRKSFDLKTLDERGIAIQKLPHEVSAVINVNGEEITLCRKFTEKWSKKRGSAIEEFTGHEEERFFNDVPCSLKEWNDKISAICSEQVFKFVTNPLYFTSQKPEVQRAMLFRMAGELTDEEVAAGNEEFRDLLSKLTGKTLEEYKKEIAAKKRRLKAEIEAIPERIDERKRDIPESCDWNAIEEEIKQTDATLSDIEAQINDRSKSYESANNARLAKMKELSELKTKKNHYIISIREKESADFYKQRAEQRDLQIKVDDALREIARLKKREGDILQYEETLAQKRTALIEEWKSIKAKQISFNDDDFVCPTCGRRFEVEEIESKQAEMTESFNANKAALLEANTKKGQQVKAEREKADKELTEIKSKIQENEILVETLKESPIYAKTLVEPDATAAIDNNPDVIKCNEDIEELEKALSTPIEAQDCEELKQMRKSISDQIIALRTQLSQRETIERNQKRIAELENEFKNQNEELASLEGIEFTIAAFTKARIEMVESRINGMFSLVRFKMFEQQINGGEIETCEAMVNGVPFSVLNNAGRINAGIDIINAICKSEGIEAPIIIDNAESVNELLHSWSQVIRLVVSDDAELNII